MNNQMVRVKTFRSSDIQDAFKKAFEFMLEFAKETDSIEGAMLAREDIEKTLTKKNFEEKLKEACALPVVIASFKVPVDFAKRTSDEFELMCVKVTFGTRSNYLLTQYEANEMHPNYELSFTNKMLVDYTRGDAVALDYVKQVGENRFFEKLGEKYTGDNVLVHLVSDPVAHTKLELQLHLQRDLETPLSGVLQTLYPGNSGYYQNVETGASKREWLSRLNLFLDENYINRKVGFEDDSFIYHQAIIKSFHSSPVTSFASGNGGKRSKSGGLEEEDQVLLEVCPPAGGAVKKAKRGGSSAKKQHHQHSPQPASSSPVRDVIGTIVEEVENNILSS